MPTKTTTKTAARKPATARKPVKAAGPAKSAEPKRKEARSVKVEAPAKGPRAVPAAPAPTTRPDLESPPKEVDTPKPAPKRVMETVSLIEEKKPRQKRADADTKRSFLPPISRLHATLEPTTVAVAPAPVAPSVTQSTEALAPGTIP